MWVRRRAAGGVVTDPVDLKVLAEQDQALADARHQGECVAAFFKALKDAGIPATTAKTITETWVGWYFGDCGSDE